jgi:hypothetical protein
MSSILKVDTIQDQSGNNIINENADTITIGASGDTITIPAGATLSNLGTASGFGLTWQSVQTTGFTAVKGNAYPCNTTSAGFTVTLPATPSAGDQVQLVDYAGTFDTNALEIDPNGEDIEGGASNLQLTGEREGVILTYIDSIQGWIATSGINEGTDALEPVPYSIDFLVVAGGGGASFGGGGAGGYRTSTQTVDIGTVITVTVGDGGAFRTNGSNSSISGSSLTTITSTGGGRGGGASGNTGTGDSGGSGGGGGHSPDAGGSGNTPSTVPSQGNNGGTGRAAPNFAGGGGGGAGAVGATAVGTGTTSGGAGGTGVASSITGSSVTRAGGGGGAYSDGTSGGIGGTGGGGRAGGVGAAQNGTVNTGGGGGGDNGTGGSGGKGVVILSMPLASFSNTTTGSPTESDDGTTKVLIFNGDGSYTT